MMIKWACAKCGQQIKLEHKISFREECPSCLADLHTCTHCRFHDSSAHNECRETSADPVRDKQKNNYCEYFEPRLTLPPGDKKNQYLKQAEELFKKK